MIFPDSSYTSTPQVPLGCIYLKHYSRRYPRIFKERFDNFRIWHVNK